MDATEYIGIFIKGYDFWKRNKLLFCPIISIYLADKASGECNSKVVYKSKEDLSLSLFNSSKRKLFGRLYPSSEKEPLIIQEKISTLISNEKILLFDICRVIKENENSEIEKKRLAWAFFMPVALDGSKNWNQDVKLQLYEVPKNCKISHQTCSIYHLYKDHKLKKFPGVLSIKVEGVSLTAGREDLVLTTDHQQKEEIKCPGDNVKEVTFTPAFQWSRLPTQSCKIPNELHMVLCFGNRGSSCVRFSRGGSRLAVASGKRIYIYNVITWTEQFTLKGHDGFIYDIDWSEEDVYLLSVSNDCTCIVWNLTEKAQSFILPHPSYVYCGKWINSYTSLITGCKDHLMRCWMLREENFELVEEIQGHSGFVTAIALQGTSTLISGDSNGCIIIHMFHNNQWTIMKQLELSETSLGIIDSIQVCNGRNRVIVSSRSKGSFMLDLKIGIITQKYKAMGNVILRSVPCLSPCGYLFFAFCQNGEVGVWNAHTAKHLASYENLYPIKGLSEICGSMHYNPFDHMIAIAALDYDYPVLLIKYGEKDDSKKLGLVYINNEGKDLNKSIDIKYKKN